jgi:predicted dehydrogenase
MWMKSVLLKGGVTVFKGIIAGLGGRGLYWVKEARNHEGCQLVGYVEPNVNNQKRAVEQHGVPKDQIFASLDEALGKVKADFVLDVTPPSVHFEVAKKAFDAGLHVLGEKPLSDDYRVAMKMVKMGAKAGLRHMITQNYRFGPQPRTTRKLLAEGIIGTPGQCDVRFYMSWADIPGSHYVTQPYMLINDMMVHHFDMIRYVLGQDPVAVHAVTWNHPWGWHKGDAAHSIVFKFDGGLWATHVCVGCAVGSRTSWNGDWRIEGPRGSISWEGAKIRRAHLHRTEKPVDEEVAPLDVPPAGKAILDEFFAAIREEREPECSAADNIKSLAMVFAAIKSAREGKWVKLDELK